MKEKKELTEIQKQHLAEKIAARNRATEVSNRVEKVGYVYYKDSGNNVRVIQQYAILKDDTVRYATLVRSRQDEFDKVKAKERLGSRLVQQFGMPILHQNHEFGIYNVTMTRVREKTNPWVIRVCEAGFSKLGVSESKELFFARAMQMKTLIQQCNTDGYVDDFTVM